MNTEDDPREADRNEEGGYGAPGQGDATPDSFIDLSDPTLAAYEDLVGSGEDEEEGYLPRLVNDMARYTGFLRVGKGGSGLVRSCRDPHLGRIVAIKTLHTHLGSSAFHRERFIQEARVMAQLEHPNVVPVHELGVDEKEASVYFTMKRVQGATLLQVIQALRDKPDDYAAEFSPARMLDVLIQVCQAVAFAHSKGVLHRDLKPENILLGSFGEVLVVDWGLAKVHGEEDEGGGRVNLSGNEKGDVTLPGTVTGTPLNMSPEQAMGDVAAVDERSDVFSLGGMLYHILTLERPFDGKDVVEILHNVIHQKPPPPRRRAPERGIPRELDAICMKALAKAPDERFQGIAEMIDELQRYRDGRPVACCPDGPLRRAWKGCRRHPVVSSAAAAGMVVLVLGASAAGLASHARHRQLMERGDYHRKQGLAGLDQQFGALQALRSIQAANPYKIAAAEEIRRREHLGRLIDESTDEFEDAALMYSMATQDTMTPRRLEAMVDIHLARIAYAREAGDHAQVARLLELPRDHLGGDFERAPPEVRDVLLEARRYAEGRGSLTLATIPEDADVACVEYTPDEQGVLRPGPARTLGRTPLSAIELTKGRYVLTLEAAGRPRVVLPVWIEHAEHEQASILLPRAVPEDMVYVPGGPFYSGGEASRSHRRHRRDVGGFFILEREVTFEEYIAYWLAPDGADHDPRDLARVRLHRDDRVYLDAWDENGALQVDGFEPGHPVVGITQGAAARFCAWKGARAGRACRLPTAYEWEKAARGVDARQFVWGDGFDPSYALIFETPSGDRPKGWFAPPKLFGRDRSVYGVYDLGGNVREWTSTPYLPVTRGLYEVKGASSATTRRFLYSAYSSDTPVVPTDIGFRYLMEMKANGSNLR